MQNVRSVTLKLFRHRISNDQSMLVLLSNDDDEDYWVILNFVDNFPHNFPID